MAPGRGGEPSHRHQAGATVRAPANPCPTASADHASMVEPDHQVGAGQRGGPVGDGQAGRLTGQQPLPEARLGVEVQG